MSIKKMKMVVPEITPTSSFSDLTLSLLYSFQETEQKMVQAILTNREKLLKDKIKKSQQILDTMLKEQGAFAALLKNKVEDLIQSRREFQGKMNEKCRVLETEGELKRRVLEEEVERLRQQCDELKRESASASLMKKKVENLIQGRVEFEEKMKERSDALDKEGELKRRVLEEEVESLRGECEKLKRDYGLMEKTISLVTLEKNQVEEEVRSQLEMLENQTDVLQLFKEETEKMRQSHNEELKRNNELFKEETEKMRESHNEELKRNNELMKKKLSLGVSEKLQLEEELKKCRMQSQEARIELEGELEKVRKNYEEELKLEGELEKVRKNYEEELKRERDFGALMKKEVENLIQSRVEFEEKMNEKCDVLEKEGELKRRILKAEVESLRDKCEELKRGSDLMENMLSSQKREMEDERRLQQEMLENQNDVLQRGFKKELETMRECHHEELERHNDIMKKKLSVGVFEKLEVEKELKKSLMQNEEARKELEGKLEETREIYEEKLRRERDFAALLKREVENMIQGRVEFEEKMNEKCDVLEKDGELKRRISEEEVEILRKKCEELKRGSDLMENMLSLQQREVENERKRQREILDNQNDVLQKGFKRELEKMRECHKQELERNCDMMKKKLSLGVFEKLQLEKELEKSQMQNEEARKELEGELQKARETYEEELKRERDLRENNLIMAELEKMDLEEELKKSRKDFEEKIQVLEGKNLELNKKLEQHIESFWKIRSLAELIKGAYDSAISGNVSANELLSNGSDAGEKASNVDGHLIEYPVSSGEPLPKTPLQAEVKCLRGKHTDVQLGEKSGCLFLENEPEEDGGYNENDGRFKCKRRRSMFESEGAGIGLCSAYFRFESHVVSSQNKEVAGCQTAKEITWRQSADMLLALRNDPELCMASVSALYRRHISARNPGNKGVLSGTDIDSATAVAKYLVNNDPTNKLSRSVLEVQQDCPYVLQTCWKLANQYKEQIFEIYQKKLDPLFCPKS